jgi:hypothetical protein
MEPRRLQGNKIRRMANRVAGAVLVAALVTACATDDSAQPRVPRSIVTDVILTVDNRTPRAVLIYLESGSWSDSLGMVARRSSRSFALPSGAGDSTSVLRLEARERRGVAGLRSQVFQLASGHQVVWTLDPNRPASMTMR